MIDLFSCIVRQCFGSNTSDCCAGTSELVKVGIFVETLIRDLFVCKEGFVIIDNVVSVRFISRYLLARYNDVRRYFREICICRIAAFAERLNLNSNTYTPFFVSTIASA